jgi:hypothetical protein
MTHGPNPNPTPITLVTVRPGPVLHVWRNGAEFVAIPLGLHEALDLIGKLTGALQVGGESEAEFQARRKANADSWYAANPLPNESLPFDDVKAEHDASRPPLTLAQADAVQRAQIPDGKFFSGQPPFTIRVGEAYDGSTGSVTRTRAIWCSQANDWITESQWHASQQRGVAPEFPVKQGEAGE